MSYSLDFLVDYIQDYIQKENCEMEEITLELFRFNHDDIDYELQFIIDNKYIYGILLLCDVFDSRTCLKNEPILIETIEYYKEEEQSKSIRSILMALLEIKEQISQYVLYKNKRGFISLLKKKEYEFKIHACIFYDKESYSCYICKEPCLKNEHLNRCKHNIHIRCAIQLYNYGDERKLTCGICRREYPILTFYKYTEDDDNNT